MHQLYTFRLTGEDLTPLEVYASVEAQSGDEALRRIRETLKPHAGALSITGPSEARGAIVSVRVDGITQANILAVDGILLDPFKDSEEEAYQVPPEDLERAWDMRKECYEPNCEPRGPDNYSDDGGALASAGWGTDEDYFFGSCD